MAEMLRATEAAVVSDTPLREVNRTVDEHILPQGFYSSGRSRLFHPSACALIAFYHASADDLTKLKRAQVIGRVESRLRQLPVHALRARLDEDWSLKDGFVTVDFAPFIARALDRLEQLREATAMVSASPEVMAGVPVVRGTRILVHDVAESLAAGLPLDEIRAAYPSLAERQIRLAALYAQANPPKGRPKSWSKSRPESRPESRPLAAQLPPGAVKVAERRVRRRAGTA